MAINFPEETEGFCFLSNFKNYLRFYGINVSKSWLGGIIGCLGFYYSSKPLKSNEVIHGRNGTFEDLFDRLQNSLFEPLYKDVIKVDSYLIPYINNMLAQEDIPLAWINDYYLEYSPYYKLADFWSIVPILEINDDNVTFFDNGIKQIKQNTFMEAVNKNCEARFYFSKKKFLKWACGEISVMESGISSTVKGFYADNLSKDEFNGFLGMERFLVDFKLCDDKMAIYNFYFQMNRPGGLSLTRNNMRQLLIELKNKWHFIENEEAIKIYEELTDQWRKIASLLFKLSGVNDVDLKSRIADRILKAVENEKKGVALLENITVQIKEGV